VGLQEEVMMRTSSCWWLVSAVMPRYTSRSRAVSIRGEGSSSEAVDKAASQYQDRLVDVMIHMDNKFDRLEAGLKGNFEKGFDRLEAQVKEVKAEVDKGRREGLLLLFWVVVSLASKVPSDVLDRLWNLIPK